MGVGPVLLFDKSTLQSLSLDEALVRPALLPEHHAALLRGDARRPGQGDGGRTHPSRSSGTSLTVLSSLLVLNAPFSTS
jgi:hypothetical protein